MEFVEIEREEFAKFAERQVNANFLQSAEMYDRYKAKGREVYLLGVKRSQKLCLVGLVVAMRKVGKWKIFNCPGGPLLDYNNTELMEFWTREAKKFLRSKGGMILQISPNIIARERDIDAEEVPGGENNLAVKDNLVKMGYKYLGEYEQAKWVYKLGVKGADLDQMYKNFRKGHKLSIRYAKDRYGVKIRELKYDELPILKELAAEAGEYHGFRPPEVTYFQEMYKAFGDKVKFFVSEMKDPETGKKVVTSGGMFMLYGPEVVYLYSGSRREYKKYGGPHLIQWQMIQYAAKNGFSEYNFYGVRPVKGNGVYAFKRGFKGRVVELLGTFILPLNMAGKAYVLRKKTEEMRGVA
ncbi:peptidoglycan bridge formation glycyltransferase FemA/FemB family protein [Candidatus Saccharibacteria bacterium]|nr:peptidoglycan bridge formation glycyltransferase FemA/FemB family protein [Candidatus Saccharibacteria bacterium]